MSIFLERLVKESHNQRGHGLAPRYVLADLLKNVDIASLWVTRRIFEELSELIYYQEYALISLVAC
jgi:hypothetical protein